MSEQMYRITKKGWKMICDSLGISYQDDYCESSLQKTKNIEQADYSSTTTKYKNCGQKYFKLTEQYFASRWLPPESELRTKIESFIDLFVQHTKLMYLAVRAKEQHTVVNLLIKKSDPNLKQKFKLDK